EVVNVGLRAQLDLFQLDHSLAFLGFVRTLLFLVLELAKVHDLADRRKGLGVDLDQVEPRFPGQALRFVGIEYTEHLPIAPDHAHLRHANTMVDTWALRRTSVAILKTWLVDWHSPPMRGCLG